MELVRFCDYNFSYPDEDKPALDNINLVIEQGEFVTVCGKSGSGKSTLLKSMKPEVTPHGKRCGKLLFSGEEIKDYSAFDGSKIGFVFQNPDTQIVTDTVWHELSFGLENMGMNQDEMRVRIAEIASFFGIEKWFSKSTSELSGGQKQLLNLASVMVMEPELLILDEPTGQLDPISAGNFFATLNKINIELGTTIILSEHRLEEIFPFTRRVVVMENGGIIADGRPDEIGRVLKEEKSDMLLAMPAAIRLYEALDGTGKSPVSVGDARTWLNGYLQDGAMAVAYFGGNSKPTQDGTALSVKDVYFRYEKDTPYVLSGLSLEVKKGEIYGLLGGNGSGKTTLLWLISGGIKMQTGKRKVFGKIGMLPQNPECLFIKNTVLDELLDMADEKEAEKVLDMCNISHLKDRHPYDLSGGEQQKLALCKVLLLNPDIILLDEPTKGLDAHFKGEFGKILSGLRKKGVAVIMVSHDVEFCAEVCDRCGLIFNGQIVSSGVPREFFGGKKFYTTQTARIFKGIADNIILPDEAIELMKNLEELK